MKPRRDYPILVAQSRGVRQSTDGTSLVGKTIPRLSDEWPGSRLMDRALLVGFILGAGAVLAAWWVAGSGPGLR